MYFFYQTYEGTDSFSLWQWNQKITKKYHGSGMLQVYQAQNEVVWVNIIGYFTRS